MPSGRGPQTRNREPHPQCYSGDPASERGKPSPGTNTLARVQGQSDLCGFRSSGDERVDRAKETIQRCAHPRDVALLAKNSEGEEDKPAARSPVEGAPESEEERAGGQVAPTWRRRRGAPIATVAWTTEPRGAPRPLRPVTMSTSLVRRMEALAMEESQGPGGMGPRSAAA